MSSKSSVSGALKTGSSRKSKHRPQHLARQRALQAMYQQQINPQPASDIIAQFLSMQDFSNVDEVYFQQLVKMAEKNAEVIAAELAPYLDIQWLKLDAMERVILSIGWVELTHEQQVPLKVVLNEAIEMAKRYGADKSHTFINGVLDKLAPQTRPMEVELLQKQAVVGS